MYISLFLKKLATLLAGALLLVLLNTGLAAQERKTAFQRLLQQATVFSFNKLIHDLCKKEFVITTKACEISLTPEKNIYKNNSHLLTQHNYHVNWHAYRSNTLSHVLINKDFFANYDLLLPYKDLLKESSRYRK